MILPSRGGTQHIAMRLQFCDRAILEKRIFLIHVGYSN